MNEEALFAAAMDMRDAAERRAFLDEACAGDARLRRRVERLLAADEHDRGILDRTAHAPPRIEDFHPESPLAAGQAFAGRFVLRQKLGEGGMGEVWVADQLEPVRRHVALKVIRAGFEAARSLARFEQERQALALMNHPNIAKVLDAGVEGGRPFFVMELIEGATLTGYCDDAKLTIRERLELFLPVCEAVQHAHTKGVIHRDLKPSNILVERHDGRPVAKVIDFGLAKATGLHLPGGDVSTEVGTVVGTLEYMSPEQAELNNLDVDTRSDVYALGVLLYELLTGGVPYSRWEHPTVTFAEMLRIIKEVEPPRPSRRLASDPKALPGIAAQRQTEPKKLLAQLRGELDWIVMRCLEKDPARRYETANELAADVRRFLADEPVLAGPPSAGYRLRKFLRRNRGAVLAAGLVLLALVGGVVGTTLGLVQAVRAQQAEAERAEGERRAKELAEKRLAQVEKGIDILGAIFDQLDPHAEEKEGRPLRAILGDRLDQVAAELEGDAVGDPLVVARLQDRLGQTYQALGHAAKAEALFARSWATRQAELGADDPLTLATASRLAGAYIDIGKRIEAIALLERVRDAQLKALGPRSLDTLTTLDNLGWTYRLAGRPAEAVALLEQVRDERAKQLGPSHDETLATLHKLARAYMAADKRTETVTLLKQVLDARVKKNGNGHPHTIAALNALAYAYQYAGKMKEALALFQQARDVSVPKLGPYHPLSLSILHNLGHMYRAYGNTAEAIPLLEEVRERQLMTLGGHHPATLATLNQLAMAHEGAGAPDKALPLYKLAAAGVERLQFAHAGADQIVRNLCQCHERLNQFADAEVWRRKWLAAVKANDGPESAAYAAELTGLGSNLLRQNKPADAEPLLRQSLAILQKKAGGWATLHTRSLLGASLAGQKNYADAEPLLVQAYQGMKKTSEKDLWHPHHGRLTRGRLREALQPLVRLYDDWGKPAEASRWRKELQALEVPAKKAASVPGAER
jgi:tetratricopeptide (TPR) repeat protein